MKSKIASKVWRISSAAAIGGVLACVSDVTLASATVMPVGGIFQVNTVTPASGSSRYDSPFLGTSVAKMADGRFVVAFGMSLLPYPDNQSNHNVYIRRYAVDGTPFGTEFIASSNPDSSSNDDFYPIVKIDANGNFLVAWLSRRTTSDGAFTETLVGRLFAADGTPRTSDFRIDSDSAPYFNGSNTPVQTYQVAMDDDGDFVVGWYDPVNNNIVVRRLAADGSAKDAQAMIVRSQPQVLDNPQVSVAMNQSTGDFTVTWDESSLASTAIPLLWRKFASIQAQAFAGDGTALSTQPILVDSCAEYFVGLAAIRQPATARTTAAPDAVSGTRRCEFDSAEVLEDRSGAFTVVLNSGSAGYMVSARRYSANGKPASARFTISPPGQLGTSDGVGRVAGDGTGRFVAIWNDVIGNQTEALFGRSVTAGSRFNGATFQISPTDPASQQHVVLNGSVALDPSGGVAVIWVEATPLDPSNIFGDADLKAFGQIYSVQ